MPFVHRLPPNFHFRETLHLQPSEIPTSSQNVDDDRSTAGDPTTVASPPSQPNTDRTRSSRSRPRRTRHPEADDPLSIYSRNSRRGVWALNALLASTILSYIACYLVANFNEIYHFVFFFGILLEVAILARWRQIRGLGSSQDIPDNVVPTRTSARRAAARRRAADEEMGISNGMSLPTYRPEAGLDEQCFPDIEMPPPTYVGMTSVQGRRESLAQVVVPVAEDEEGDASTTGQVITEPPPGYWSAIAGLTGSRNSNDEAQCSSTDRPAAAVVDM